MTNQIGCFREHGKQFRDVTSLMPDKYLTWSLLVTTTSGLFVQQKRILGIMSRQYIMFWLVVFRHN